MNIFRTKYLQHTILIVLAVSLNCLATSCLAQTKTDVSETKNISTANERPIDCVSPNQQQMVEWQGNKLHKAVLDLDVKKVKSLMRKKIDINEKDSYGNTALISALTPIISEPSATATVSNRQKQAKLQFEIAKILLEKGADVNIKGYAGKTALIRAVLLDDSVSADIVMLLVKNKANLGIQDNEGTTALMEAARTNRVEMVKILLGSKAAKDLKNCQGLDAFSIAQKNSFTKVMQLLSASN